MKLGTKESWETRRQAGSGQTNSDFWDALKFQLWPEHISHKDIWDSNMLRKGEMWSLFLKVKRGNLRELFFFSFLPSLEEDYAALAGGTSCCHSWRQEESGAVPAIVKRVTCKFMFGAWMSTQTGMKGIMLNLICHLDQVHTSDVVFYFIRTCQKTKAKICRLDAPNTGIFNKAP